ncbi:serine/threonine-protein kinase [Paraclostridium sordellii]|uniref:serine/threonine-protein kinase n=1 Tax=Paraclostridium sordellii TaxID=1505 RepID=UPI00189B2F9B|nr:serine/threonine-protein kinase [Paeniclostridium sordellii]MCR1849753.1 serine/threonine protein kinase [Paeniclostridium sordellii]
MIYIGNRYKIIDEIVRGCRSCLYKGKDSYDNQMVIVNVIDEGVITNKNFVSNLIDEATTINEIDSPNILKIRDVGIHKLDDGCKLYYTVSEYIEGSTLDQLTKYHRLNTDEIVIILRQILNALEVAHSYDIYHGNLQPSSIIIDEGYNVKLSNIGIIRANNKIFNNGIKKFSKNLRYMCPHQICLGYTDKSSDFYALGIILFELIFGTHPFGDIEDEESMLRKMDKGIKWNDFNTEIVPKHLLNIIDKLLRRDEKYTTPQEVMIDLSKHLYETENICDENSIKKDLEIINPEINHKRNLNFKKIGIVVVAAIISFLILGMTIV